MPINPSIPLQVQPPQQIDLTRGFEQGARMARLAALSEREQREAQDKAREQQEKDAIVAVLRETNGDLSAALPRIRSINPLAATKIETDLLETRKAKLEFEKLRLGFDEAKIKWVAQQLGAVTDQDSWDRFRAKHRATFGDEESLPEVYDPATVDGYRRKGLTLEQQLNATKKNLERITVEVGGEKRIGAFDPQTGAITVAGQDVTQDARPTADAERGGFSDYARFETDYLDAAAARLGKTVGQLTAAERVKLKTEARKQFGQADDAARRPFAPIVIQTPSGPMVTTGDARQSVVPITGPGGQTIANKLPGAMIEKVAGLENVGDILGRVRETYNADWVGPAVGRYNETVRLNTPGRDLPAGMANFATNLAAVKNWFVKAITGAQMSEPEAQRIMAQIPKWSDKPELFNANLEASERNAAFLANRIMQLSGARGGGQQPPPSTVSQLLSGKGPGRYTLSDGSVWEKAQSGALTKVK